MNKNCVPVFLLCWTLIILIFGISCSNGQQPELVSEKQYLSPPDWINEAGTTISERFRTPEGFQRIKVEEHSFQAYLRELRLKPDGDKVKFYDGRTKPSNVYEAVVDLPIGNKDLHQCADAVMRLRAEFLWQKGNFNEIHFNFTNGFRVDYLEWMKGRRVVVQGNKTFWNDRNSPSNTYQDFWKYMEVIFAYAGTLSLSKELQTIPFMDMNIGDVLIQGGSPGHAVIVVDMAINLKTQEKVYLLAQSYMPAQEIQVLKNLQNGALGPWYSLNDQNDVVTPEWRFGVEDLKRF